MENGRTALILIDMQLEYFDESRPLQVPDGQDVLVNAVRLLGEARGYRIPVVHIKHVTHDPQKAAFRAGSLYTNIMSEVMPVEGEKVIEKSVPGAFYGTDLDEYLGGLQVDTVILAGLMSFMCCDTTAREAHARGYRVIFVKDATAAIDLGYVPAEVVQSVTLAVQDFMFSDVVDTEKAIEVIKEGVEVLEVE